MSIILRNGRKGRRAGVPSRGVEAPNGGVFNAAALGGSTLKLWLRADSKNIVFNGGDVSGWNDLSSNANNLAQAIGANQPLWVASRQNLKPCVEFTAANGDRLARAATNLVGAGSYTFFIVHKARNAVSQAGYFCNDVAARTSGISYGTLGSVGDFTRNTNHDGLVGHEMGAEDTNAKVVSIRFNVSSGAIDSQINGADTATTNQPGAAILDPGGAAVLAIGSGPIAANFSDLDCYEILFYSSALSASDRARVTGYLRGRYAL